jgi:hypothetical protein
MRWRLQTSFRLMPDASILHIALPKAGENLLGLLGLRGAVLATTVSATWPRDSAVGFGLRFFVAGLPTPGFFFLVTR